MLMALAFIFIILPVLEIYLFIRVGDAIGAVPTIGLVFLMAAAGAAVIRFGAPRAIGMAQDSLRSGVAPVHEVMDGVAIVIAGGLLILPGFFTDAVGLLLLIPWVRRGLGYAVLYKAMAPRPGRPGTTTAGVVDGEFEVVLRPGGDRPAANPPSSLPPGPTPPA